MQQVGWVGSAQHPHQVAFFRFNLERLPARTGLVVENLGGTNALCEPSAVSITTNTPAIVTGVDNVEPLVGHEALAIGRKV